MRTGSAPSRRLAAATATSNCWPKRSPTTASRPASAPPAAATATSNCWPKRSPTTASRPAVQAASGSDRHLELLAQRDRRQQPRGPHPRRQRQRPPPRTAGRRDRRHQRVTRPRRSSKLPIDATAALRSGAMIGRWNHWSCACDRLKRVTFGTSIERPRIGSSRHRSSGAASDHRSRGGVVGARRGCWVRPRTAWRSRRLTMTRWLAWLTGGRTSVGERGCGRSEP